MSPKANIALASRAQIAAPKITVLFINSSVINTPQRHGFSRAICVHRWLFSSSNSAQYSAQSDAWMRDLHVLFGFYAACIVFQRSGLLWPMTSNSELIDFRDGTNFDVSRTARYLSRHAEAFNYLINFKGGTYGRR